MKLTEAQKNVPLTVVKVRGEPKTVRRLLQLGIYEGAGLRVIGVSPFRASLLIETDGVRIAVCHTVACGVSVWRAEQ